MIDELVRLADAVGAVQARDGSLPGGADGERARESARRAAGIAADIATSLGAPEQARTIVADTMDWLAAGASKRPDFSRTRDAMRAPDDGRPFFFFGPLRLANGGRTGYRFETFLAMREEPTDAPYRALYEAYPHPKNICQSAHLLAGSAGLTRGNNIVFFPENIAAPDVPDRQLYALFFFNKFKRIYGTITVPTWDAVGNADALRTSRDADPRRLYEARCVWGYLHDYYHHRGPRPFDEQIGLKTRWFTGLLEELKVDLASYLACRKGGVPQGDTVADFILFDRTMRYPGEPDWSRNFDSGTGLLLLAHLHEAGALEVGADGRLVLDLDGVDAAAASFVSRVEALEALDDARYLAAAEAMVRHYLPAPEGEEIRFGAPAFLRASAFAERIGKAPSVSFTFEEEACGAGVREAIHALRGRVPDATRSR
ncbi:DUF6421 family protein [Salinarimonas ramus]|uniref:Uncharacterized protein n=1 Tax=Salinarimonas ramus TaxID=690164 RepID=A0A917Q3X5_9HYPH|nr:DUF6421 family protein [Salinarimonas ramus]GGK18904.1 hypothetical protein GCM10011322_02040 [Salinarimonas ramus]